MCEERGGSVRCGSFWEESHRFFGRFLVDPRGLAGLFWAGI